MKARSLPALAYLAYGLFQTDAAEKIDFIREVKPILETACVRCHGAEHPKGQLRLDTRAGAEKGGDKAPALIPGQPDKSPLYTSTILAADHEDKMPPKGESLSKAQTEKLRLWIAQGADWPVTTNLVALKKIDFAREIKPILETSCLACHQPGHAKGDLRLDTREQALKGGESGPSIVPGNSGKSRVHTSTAAPADSDELMPPKNKGGPLPKESVELLRAWIDQGADWPESFVLVPVKAEVASAGNEESVVAEIYRMIMQHLDATNEAQMRPYTETLSGTNIVFTMMPIPGGEYTMGTSPAEANRNEDEGPQHRVSIQPFWMGKYEVTWDEYELFMRPEMEAQIMAGASNPYTNAASDAVSRPTKPYVEMSFGMGKEGFPAISMTQHAANKYCEWLSAKTGHFYRLPTEAEWEYACRAGTTTAYYFGDDPKLLPEYAWFADNSDGKYQKVGRKKPNPWGLYDMSGNVMEWCLDQYNPKAYDLWLGTTAHDPWIKATKSYPHVARGGSWYDEPKMLRSGARVGSDKSWKIQDPQLPKSIWYLTDAQFLGFRVVRPLKVPGPEELSKCWTSGVEKD